MVSFKTFRLLLFQTQFLGWNFLAISYNKTALAVIHCHPKFCPSLLHLVDRLYKVIHKTQKTTPKVLPSATGYQSIFIIFHQFRGQKGLIFFGQYLTKMVTVIVSLYSFRRQKSKRAHYRFLMTLLHAAPALGSITQWPKIA